MGPRTGHPRGWIVRPPKSRIFKDKPTTTGLAQTQGPGQAQAQGQGTKASGQNSNSRRRARRGGGSAAPPGTSVLNSGIRSVQSLCPKSLSKVSVNPLHSPPPAAHFPRRPLILVPESTSWSAFWSKKLPSKTSSNKFQKMWFFLRKNNDF